MHGLCSGRNVFELEKYVDIPVENGKLNLSGALHMCDDLYGTLGHLPSFSKMLWNRWGSCSTCVRVPCDWGMEPQHYCYQLETLGFQHLPHLQKGSEETFLIWSFSWGSKQGEAEAANFLSAVCALYSRHEDDADAVGDLSSEKELSRDSQTLVFYLFL